MYKKICNNINKFRSFNVPKVFIKNNYIAKYNKYNYKK